MKNGIPLSAPLWERPITRRSKAVSTASSDYITTAACESQGKADDCYELELLRSYRDEYLMNTEDGEALVKEYYNIAPTIVNRIGRQENKAEIYAGIWDTYLTDCIHLIEEKENEACQKRYMDMVYDLKQKYMA